MAIGKRRPRSLKGAVLVMVVTILFILIVMLLATLAVVSSSTQRTYTKFEENQAYYSARSVLEVYIKEVLSDNTTSGSAFKANEGKIIAAMKQGGFNVVKYTDDTGNPVDGLNRNPPNSSGAIVDYSGSPLSNGFAYQQEIFGYLEPKYKWAPGTTDPGLTDPKDNRNWVVENGNKNKCFVEYEATVPDLSSPTMTANAGAHGGKFDTDGKVKVRVELLRVLYRNSSGKIITDNVQTTVPDGVTGGKGKLQTVSVTTGDEDFVVDWKKTYYRIKVTATADLADSEVSVSVLLEPTPVNNPAGFRNAMTSVDSSSTFNQLFTIGGASADMTANPNACYAPGNNSAAAGKYVYKGNVYINTEMEPWMMTQGESYNVYKGVLFFENTLHMYTNYDQAPIGYTGDAKKLQNRPFIYCEGYYGYGGGTKQIGNDTSHPIDVFATSKGDGQHLHGFTGGYAGYRSSTLNNAVTVQESAICPSCVTDEAEKNKVAFVSGQNGSDFYGDVYVDGNMYLHQQAKFYGTVYCTGNIYVDNDDSNMVFTNGYYCNNLLKASDGTACTTIPSNYTYQGTCSMDLAGVRETNTNADGFAEFTLPSARAKLQVPTKENVISSFYKDPATKTLRTAEEQLRDDMQSSTAKLDISSTGTKVKPSDCTSRTINFTDAAGNALSVTGPTFPTVTPDSDGDLEYIMDMSDYYNGNGTYYVDCTSSPVHVMLKGYKDNQKQKIVFVGDKPVRITVPDGENLCTHEMQFWNYELYKLTNDGNHSTATQKMNLGDKLNSADPPQSPNISWYIGDGAVFNIYNGNKVGYAGYFYGPKAKLDANVTSDMQGPCTYNGVNVHAWNQPETTNKNIQKLTFFGAVLFEKVDVQNPMGVYYIKPDANGGGSGGAGGNIDWSRQRYLNT